jgi:hypothetical protein
VSETTTSPGTHPSLIRWILIPLLLLLCWLPPEAHGESMAGIAALTVLLFLVSRGLGLGTGGAAWILIAATAVALVAWLAPVPCAAIEPGSLWVLAIGVAASVPKAVGARSSRPGGGW